MSKAKQQSITRKLSRVGKYSNITGQEITDTPSSTKVSKHSSTISIVRRKNKYAITLTKEELLRRENLAKRKLKAAS